jgi:choline transport protein
LGSVTDILATPTGYPFIQVFYNVTNSYVGTSFMTAILIVNITSASISTVATASRQTWSFARDKGLPFSSFISYVSDFLV